MLKAQSFCQIACKRRGSVKISRRSGRDILQACSIRALQANLIPTRSAGVLYLIVVAGLPSLNLILQENVVKSNRECLSAGDDLARRLYTSAILHYSGNKTARDELPSVDYTIHSAYRVCGV